MSRSQLAASSQVRARGGGTSSSENCNCGFGHSTRDHAGGMTIGYSRTSHWKVKMGKNQVLACFRYIQKAFALRETSPTIQRICQSVILKQSRLIKAYIKID